MINLKTDVAVFESRTFGYLFLYIKKAEIEVWLGVRLSVDLYVCLLVCIFIFHSVDLRVFLSACRSVWVYVCVYVSTYESFSNTGQLMLKMTDFLKQ